MMTRRVLVPITVVAIVVAVLAVITVTPDRSRPDRGVAATVAPPVLPGHLDGLDPMVADLVGRAHAAVRSAPHDADAWMHYATALHANEFHVPAADAYRVVVRLDPARPRAWYLLGRVATRLGRTDEALAAFDQAVVYEPRYGPAFWRRGLLLLDLGRPADALPPFERAVAIEGPHSAGGLGRARAWLATGRIDDAIGALEAHLDADGPNAGYARNLLATAYRRADRADEAMTLAAAAGDAKPNWPDPWEQTLADLRPGYGARIGEARALIAAGHAEEAIVMLEELREDHPGNLTVQSNLGLAYRQRGRFDESVAVLTGAIERDDAFFLAHFHLAVAYGQMSAAADPPRPPETLRADARRHLDRVLDINPTYAAAHSLLGDLARLDGDPGAAAGHYREATRCDPVDPRWSFRVGVTLLELERWTDAAAALARAAAMAPRDAEVRRGQAVAAIGLGLLDEAERALRTAETLAPGDPRVAATRRRLDAARAAAKAGIP